MINKGKKIVMSEIHNSKTKKENLKQKLKDETIYKDIFINRNINKIKHVTFKWFQRYCPDKYQEILSFGIK